MREIISFHFG